ncbi:ParB/Srx family N-terminal domain-containing protein, partial [Mesorhizobium sp. M0902]|uniref:ParB/Srx family N-terminal domain-containing protein n=1 Tax=Mesorhizobium sp. M0902 TaxID=2957021 RepID=UPI00333DD4E5
MAKNAIQKIAMNAAENIPYDKLRLSQKNVRRIKDGVSIEQLAEDIGRRKLIQSLNVRPMLDGEGEETGTFEVPAGGRRYLALAILIKQKRLAKNEPIPCIVNRRQETSAEEDSLAENLRRTDLLGSVSQLSCLVRMAVMVPGDTGGAYRGRHVDVR